MLDTIKIVGLFWLIRIPWLTIASFISVLLVEMFWTSYGSSIDAGDIALWVIVWGMDTAIWFHYNPYHELVGWIISVI